MSKKATDRTDQGNHDVQFSPSAVAPNRTIPKYADETTHQTLVNRSITEAFQRRRNVISEAIPTIVAELQPEEIFKLGGFFDEISNDYHDETIIRTMRLLPIERSITTVIIYQR
jgi:hypothetical protein